MKKIVCRKMLALLCCWALLLGVFPSVPGLVVSVEATVTNDLTDKNNIGLSNNDDDGKWTAEGATISGEITGTAAVAGSGCSSDTPAASKTTTLTITNKSGGTRVLNFSFTCSIDGNGSITINGKAHTEYKDGTVSVQLETGESISIALVTDIGEYTTEINISHLTLSTLEATVSATFLAAPEITSYTVGGTAVSSDTLKSDISEANGIAVSAPATYTATENGAQVTYMFLGWKDQRTGATVSGGTYASATIKPTNSAQIKPVYIKQQDAVFQVGSNKYYTWEDAFNAANGSGTVILLRNYTLPATLEENGLPETNVGSYVKIDTKNTPDTADDELQYKVPSGVTFLIPYNDAHTGLAVVNEEKIYPQVVDGVGSTLKKDDFPTVYEKGTLTVGANTTIESKGTFIVNGQQLATDQRDTGSACGPHGRVNLTTSTSKLHIQSGTLYCYGFIIGNGIVEVDSGAKVYELIQLTDWRGFTATLSWMGENIDPNDTASYAGLLSMLSKEQIIKMQQTNRSFVFSQYYVQNIEADLQLKVGAELDVALAMNTKEDTPQFIIPFIAGNDALLNLSGSGSILREYDSSQDRTTYTMDCDVTTGSIAITFGMQVSFLDISGTIYSQYNIFPINSNLSFVVKPNRTFTVACDMKLLPEASVDVEAGGNLVLSEGTEFFLYDKEDWSAGSYAYNADLYRVNYSASRNGQPYARTIDESSKLNIDGTMTVEPGAGVFTTAGYQRNGGSVVADKKSTDKIVTGSGTINVKDAFSVTDTDTEKFGKLDEFEFSGSHTIAHQITTIPFVGKLAGITAGTAANPYDSFGVGTYYGLGKSTEKDHKLDAKYDDYWYQSVISVEESTDGISANTALPVVATSDYKNNGGIVGYSVNGVEFPFTVAEGKIATDNVTKNTYELDSSLTVEADTKLSFLPVANVVVNGAATSYYDMDDAINAYNDADGAKYLQLSHDYTKQDVALEDGTYLDLNGHNVANVSVDGTGTLYGADSTGNNYGKPDGSIQLTAAPELTSNVNNRNYVAVPTGTNTNTYQFYRCEIVPITAYYYYNPDSHSHLAFEAQVLCYTGNDTDDVNILSLIKDVGFQITAAGTAADTTVEGWFNADKEANTTLGLSSDAPKVAYTALTYEANDQDMGKEYTVIAKAAFDAGRNNVIVSNGTHAASMNKVLQKAGVLLE